MRCGRVLRGPVRFGGVRCGSVGSGAPGVAGAVAGCRQYVYWRAFYSGDGNNTATSSACADEQLVIGPNTTGLTTTTSESTGAIGDVLTDSATLTGATAGAGGTIDFYLFAPGGTACNTSGTGAVYSSTGVPVISNGTYFSKDGVTKTGSNTTTVAGTYTWVAVYTDGSNNVSSHSTCGDENVVISPNAPTITTSLSATTGAIGDTVHDSSTLRGATADAGGTVKYAVYSSLATCNAGTLATPGGTDAGSTTVSGGVVPNSDGMQFNIAGTFYWRAFYSGDGNNTATSSACADEILVIAPAPPPTIGGAGVITQPPTDVAAGNGGTANPSNGEWLLIVVLGILAAGIVLLSPARVRSRR
jgi:hypothetical protein